jgi:predicted Zn-dependent protease
MTRYAQTAVLSLAFLAAGCPQSQTVLVPDNPFGKPPLTQSAATSSLAPAALENAARVDRIGRQLVVANKQIGMRPSFQTIGSPQLEVFHHNQGAIVITEGLVKQCATDGQLAAILGHELGRMVAEREELTGPRAERGASAALELQVGSDNAGSFGPSDRLRQAELAKLDGERQRRNAIPLDPQALCRTYLTNAGFAPTELDAVLPLLHDATANPSFAKPLAGAAPSTPK